MSLRGTHMDIRIKEAARYLGYKKGEADEKILGEIRDSFQELERNVKKKSICHIFELTFLEKDRLRIGNMEVQSKNLGTNLKDCKEAALFGATLGVEADRLIQKCQLMDMAKAVVMQACAAALLEEYCDSEQEKLGVQLQQEKKYLRPRFSPGYGDFSIQHQTEVLRMLDAPKRIGLAMTESYMLTPTKSVTAVIGISEREEKCNIKGCEACDKLDCTYRRS